MSSVSALLAREKNNFSKVLQTEVNESGVYSFKLLIRGKPWLVSVDDFLLTDDSNNLVFAQGGELWVSLLEKAWAKVEGSYTSYINYSSEQHVLRALTGAPTFTYMTSEITNEVTASLAF